MNKTPPKQKNKDKSALKRLGITFAVFSALLIIMIILRQFYPVAMFLHRTLSLGFNFLFANIVNIIPFSVFEIFVYFAIVFVLTCIVLSIVFLAKKKHLKALRSFLAVFLAAIITVTTFFMSSGFSYAQKVSPAPIYSGDISLADFKRITTHFLDDFNYLAANLDRNENGSVIQPYTDKELSNMLNDKFNDANLNGLFRHNTQAKVFRSSRLMSEFGVAGVFFPPLSEANINALLPASSRPFVMAHEIAHARGVMREDFANEAAWYVTLNSDSDFIRYSGYMSAFNALVWGFWQFGEYDLVNEFFNKLHENIEIERQNNTTHWLQFHRISHITNWVNDLFLRIMGQEDGTGAYTPDFDYDEEYATDPDTGEVIINPDTGKPEIIRIPEFNTLQKTFFYIYKNRPVQ
ncbi:MAG: DUF3810 domain-containing protein [Firmicutes bacterium]|nr:DUF3810 domain-containing protein [Bacillota bacterium]